MEVDSDGSEVLSRWECLRLLATTTVGRVGVSCDALPLVLPVSFALIDDQVVFRAGIGTKLDVATREAVVAFEVDELDPIGHAWWSVMVTGVARDVARDLRLAVGPALMPVWAPPGGDRVVSVSTDIISGRRVKAR